MKHKSTSTLTNGASQTRRSISAIRTSCATSTSRTSSAAAPWRPCLSPCLETPLCTLHLCRAECCRRRLRLQWHCSYVRSTSPSRPCPPPPLFQIPLLSPSPPSSLRQRQGRLHRFPFYPYCPHHRQPGPKHSPDAWRSVHIGFDRSVRPIYWGLEHRHCDTFGAVINTMARQNEVPRPMTIRYGRDASWLSLRFTSRAIAETFVALWHASPAPGLEWLVLRHPAGF